MPADRRDLGQRFAARLGDSEGLSLTDGPEHITVSRGEVERCQKDLSEMKEKLAARKEESALAKEHLRRPAPRPILFTRRTHGTRLRASPTLSRRAKTESPSRGDPHLAGEGDPPSKSADDGPWPPPERLLADLGLHLRHAGPHGVEREWFEIQVAGMGYAIERVRAAIALVVSLGQVRAEVTDDGDHVLYAVFGGRAR